MAAEQRAGSQRRGDRPVRSDGRVPPHNLQAEESVLGALLLSRDAIGIVSEQGLQPSDFYRPAHQHVYDAIRALYSSGAPVDTVTVADELRRAGLLDEVGGTGALHELQNATPAISSAGHYARIVQDTAMLRRLIYVAGDIAELAYGEPDDVTKALDEAESKVFAVAEQRVTDSTRQIDELLSEAMDRLQDTFDRGDTITGSATGYHDLDELLSGLQASALYIVGARPAMGKCVAWDTPMVDTDTGEVVTVDEMMRRATQRGRLDVLAVDGSHRVVPAEVGAVLDDGLKPVFEVTTRTGRRVVVTASHPFLTAHGWRPLADIAVGDSIAVPCEVPVFGHDDLPDAEIDLHAARAVDRIPSAVFRLPRRRLARFLNRLFATDGSAGVSQAGCARIAYATTSIGLARDVAHVLLRFGIRATLRPRHVQARDAQRVFAYEVEVRDAASLIRFADEIGILGNDAVVARVRDAASAVGNGWPADTVPVEAWDDVVKAKGSLSWREVNRRTGRRLDHDWHPHRGRLRRSTVAELAHALDDDVLRRWASPDVCWDDVVSIRASGWTRVIDFNVPSLHNFVAADICLHNTAFGLGMATHIAQHSQKPVLVFSLEMGHAELTQRIISSEARVDSTRIRTGRLAEADWAKIGKAIGRLEVPLFLDDNPRVTVMEIRAKARRIKARYGGLALIVIDYLQLMSGGGNPENRQLEVSEISRSLKILARELEVPIVALSQLSRNLESRSDKRPMLSDLRESGCLTAGTTLVRADTNAEITLGELVRRAQERIPVWSLDERLRLVPGVVTNAFSSGIKETFRLRLSSGRWVDASANHPFLTVDGWRRVDELAPGDAIASARRIPPAGGERSMPDAGLVPLGPLIDDGCTLRRHAMQHATTGPGNVAEELAPGEAFSQPPSSAMVAEATHDPWPSALATSDVTWDRIVAIEPLGPQPVFDATVDGTHNFVANGIIAHNSLEQDADVVMFLYRDEVYNPESPDKGSAEVIVAKHRSGPIGTKRLVFLGQYTRFDNAARGV